VPLVFYADIFTMSTNLPHENLVLIGMPGSGKSTVGVILAKQSSHGFVDTDVLIQTTVNRPLQDIVDNNGYLALRQIEEEVLLGLNVSNHVISTGGSTVYSDPAMKHLGKDGLIVFLDVTLETLRRRITNFDTRGIARRPDQSFEDLFEERFALYTRYADIVIDCNALTTEQVCEAIMTEVKRRHAI
jgi:shikimate kinase